MAVQRRENWLSQQRVDVPDMKAVESAASSDFDTLIQALVTNTTKGYVVRGFSILITAGTIGGAASNLLMRVASGAVLHIDASQSGTFLMVPAATPDQQLNSFTNSVKVVGSFVPNAVNYVTIDYTRTVDDTTRAQVYLWNPTSKDETTINAPRALILDFVINISTVSPTSNQLPIASVLTDGSNLVRTITDDRDMFGRLASGGINPDQFHVYPWSQTRVESPSPTTASDGVDPFNGADKNIGSLKEWMDAIMTSVKEISGTQYWYQPAGDSLFSLREDLGNTVVTGSGSIAHGIIPNSTPILITTGNINGTNQLTSLASTTGLVIGQYIFGNGIQLGTTISNIVGSTVTMSKVATLTVANDTVIFYDSSVITAAGQVNWDQPLFIDVIGSILSYKIDANYNSSYITLADDQAAYFTIGRGLAISPKLIFANGSSTVSSVGNVAWASVSTGTSLPSVGDYIKLSSAPDSKYYKIGSVTNTHTVVLTTPYGEPDTGSLGASSQFAYGEYYASAAPGGDPRAIQISTRETVPVTQNTYWLFLREDNSGPAKVYVRILDTTLADGQSTAVASETTSQLPNNYDETVTIVTSGQTPPTSLNGPLGTVTFTCTAANATIGAVYSNSGENFTVNGTIVAGTTLATTSQGGFPANSGTLTKVSGAGDATITYSSYGFTGATITLPNNTRELGVAQYYLVNSAKLELFLNGQELVVNTDYAEVGTVNTMSNQVTMLIPLVVGDVLDFRIGLGGGSGLLGPIGPAGATGPAGSNGHDAAGGPVAITTKGSNYSVLTSDNVLLGDASGGNIIFTMPTAASASGHVFYFKKKDNTANTVTIAGNGFDLIDGASTKVLYVQYEEVTLITDGTSWWLF